MKSLAALLTALMISCSAWGGGEYQSTALFLRVDFSALTSDAIRLGVRSEVGSGVPTRSEMPVVVFELDISAITGRGIRLNGIPLTVDQAPREAEGSNKWLLIAGTGALIAVGAVVAGGGQGDKDEKAPFISGGNVDCSNPLNLFHPSCAKSAPTP